jgi:hypothetical protein
VHVLAALEACAANKLGAASGLPLPLARRIHVVLATVVQQFSGNIFRISESQVRLPESAYHLAH